VTPSAIRRLFGVPGEPHASTQSKGGFHLACSEAARDQIQDVLLTHPQICFPDLRRLLKLSKTDGRIMQQVLGHVITWLNPEPTALPAIHGKKRLSLHTDLLPAVSSLSPTSLRRLQETRSRVPCPYGLREASSAAETAALMLQHEILEHTLHHLALFRQRDMHTLLELTDLDAATYPERFQHDVWYTLLTITRAYTGEDTRREWGPGQGKDASQSPTLGWHQAQSLAADLCSLAGGLEQVQSDPVLDGRMRSTALQAALAKCILDHCNGSQRVPRAGQERTAAIQASTPPRPAASTATPTRPREAERPAIITSPTIASLGVKRASPAQPSSTAAKRLESGGRASRKQGTKRQKTRLEPIQTVRASWRDSIRAVQPPY
jgi:hypothetical protein